MIEVTRNWIIYNRTASQSTAGGESSHAGNFTLALPLHTMIAMYMTMMMLMMMMMVVVMMMMMMMVVIVMMIVMMMMMIMVAIVMIIMIAIVMMLVMMIMLMIVMIAMIEMMMICFSSRLPLRTGSAGTPVHFDRGGHLRVLDTGTRAHHDCSADRVGGFQDRFR